MDHCEAKLGALPPHSAIALLFDGAADHVLVALHIRVRRSIAGRWRKLY